MRKLSYLTFLIEFAMPVCAGMADSCYIDSVLLDNAASSVFSACSIAAAFGASTDGNAHMPNLLRW